ncbi:hypothetical protein GON03_09820 [Nocardioides sp. MAH-18]|uniref:Uncharacterized protein n=1 Tax=Nocardioides agri TaxID=2682843 RepID=A0A6L6XQR7_9ACTN|nr:MULTISPECIES: hypothetical protein [unclassified Nocardioides]MBA2954623.1 hypothetical protein [Nocardioides sp. CGMCC 1.13656]MVQ49480.1 hypothetical protein [Nocardioides sp. MAH-18]
MIERGRATVWDGLTHPGHPAWNDYPSGQGSLKVVGTCTPLEVGFAQMALVPASSADGVRGVLYTEITAIEPGYMLATNTIATGAFEQTETIRLLDHPDGGAIVDCLAWVNTVAMTQARARRLQHNLGRLQVGYLRRAQNWTSQTGHRPNILSPEADDLPYI